MQLLDAVALVLVLVQIGTATAGPIIGSEDTNHMSVISAISLAVHSECDQVPLKTGGVCVPTEFYRFFGGEMESTLQNFQLFFSVNPLMYLTSCSFCQQEAELLRVRASPNRPPPHCLSQSSLQQSQFIG